MLLQHNLISGWRNILKYKTQNIISVLCLSVGTVFFAVVVWIMLGIWNTGTSLRFDNSTKIVFFENLDGESSNIHYLESQELMKIQQLPSVKELNYFAALGVAANIMDDKGKQHERHAAVFAVSPNWCKMQKFKSAITGKRYGTLENGTMLMVDRTRDMWFTKTVNPVGFEVMIDPKRRIDDVIDTSSSFDGLEGFYLVTDGSNKNIKGDYHFILSTIYVTINDDSSFAEFEKEVKKVVPNKKVVFLDDDDEARILTLIYFLAFIILGSSVLVIGLSGYLKMQIQLFNLRSRELALRRCNGAKPIHLFMLLLAELLIAFLIVAVVTILLSLAISEYLMPILASIDAMRYINLNIFDIFNIEMAIIIATLICSIIISWFSVRKVISIPLGKTAGRSNSTKSAMHSVMQVVQYFVATILLFVIISTFVAIQTINGDKHYSNPPDYYKEVTFMRAVDFDNINCQSLIPSAERIGKMKDIYWRVTDSLSYDLISSVHNFRENNDTSSYYNYQVKVLTPQAAAIMNMKVEAKNNENAGHSIYKIMIPVYVPASEAGQIAKELGLDYQYERNTYILSSGVEYVRLGYSHVLDDRSGNKDLYIIRTDNDWEADNYSNTGLESHLGMTILKAKEGKYQKMCEEISNVYRLLIPSLDGDVNLTNAYELWFKELIVINLIRQLCYLLAFISIISIILSVYSTVSLDTRGRQKEVAIRKVNGAKTKDIVMLFCRYHIVTLCIAFVIAFIFALAILTIISMTTGGSATDNNEFIYLLFAYAASISIITTVTFCTIWQKINKIARLNPSEMIKKE